MSKKGTWSRRRRRKWWLVVVAKKGLLVVVAMACGVVKWRSATRISMRPSSTTGGTGCVSTMPRLRLCLWMESDNGFVSNVAGLGRFHELAEFDDTKRSCRRRLAGHNERRRKNGDQSQAEGSSRKGTGTPQLKDIACGQADERERIQLQENAPYKHFQIR